ncbi:hypothetical protein AX14_001525 [Amanita brunnescens Koide BX004]|nr:hypothetical protein AX14_001525 [Amanita brunnescens Koide BX004]
MSPAPWTPGDYPPTRRSQRIDVYKSASKGEVCVPDPYQWMEEPSKEVENWTTIQTTFAQTYLDQFPDRPRLEERFRSILNHAKFSAPTLLDDGHWVWFHNSGLQPQAVLYRSKEPALPDFSKDDCEIGNVFFDPNLLASDGDAAVLTCRFSPCGQYFAYAISHLGGDFVTIYVRPIGSPLRWDAIAKGEDGRLPDEVKWCKFISVITWTKDSRGFLYQRFPPRRLHVEGQNDRNAMICYHRVGTTQAEDFVVHQDVENPDWIYDTNTSDDGRYLYLYLFKDTSKRNLVWVAELDGGRIGPELKWRKVINKYVADYTVITNHGLLLYVRTNLDAPQYKVVTVDLAMDEPEIRDFILAVKDAKLVQVNCVNKDYFVVIYKRNVKDEIYIYSKEGVQLTCLASDFVGSASIANREKQPHFFITLSGFTTPSTVAYYDFTLPETQRYSIIRTTKVQGLNIDDFEATQVWYNSCDGTKVPMFIVRHKSTKFDGTAAAIQYGYGGFAMSASPFFSPILLSFMQTYGAVLALPNIRGGGEFGEQWHRGGRRENKVC